jgi:ABC-2 type transport system permease protein
VNAARVRTLVGKELTEFRANPGVLLPVALLIAVCIALPLVVLVVAPRLTGETLAADPAMLRLVQLVLPRMPELAPLAPAAAIEAFMFQQFLILFLLTPVIGAVSLAAYSVVGEKQGRTLEPLLTTPLTTVELLIAKVLSALLPSLVLEAIGLIGYLMLIRALASPGVFEAILTLRSAILVLVVGPLSALVALQMTIAVSSRTNDVRSAQQTAVLIVLPLVGLLIGQLVGAFVIPPIGLALLGVALAATWLVLVVVSVAVFERETILTRWK